MLFKNSLFQRASIALWLIALLGCSKPCRQWILYDTVTCNPCYNSACLFLVPETGCFQAELEISRSKSGVRVYLNLYTFTPPFTTDENKCTTLELLVEGEEPYPFTAYVLDGYQRLLLTDEPSNSIIELLLDGKCFEIGIGRNKFTVIADSFAENYEAMMAIPIATE